MIKSIRLFFVGLGLGLGLLAWSVPALAQTLPAYGGPPTLRAPAAGTGLTLTYNQGWGNSGGIMAALPAGTVTVADNQYSCNAPQFPACNIVYWAGGPIQTLTSTTSPSVAFAPGMEAIAYVTTFGGSVTQIVPIAASVVEVPVGTAIRFPFGGGLLLPVCNALLKQGCQPNAGSLSGY